MYECVQFCTKFRIIMETLSINDNISFGVLAFISILLDKFGSNGVFFYLLHCLKILIIQK